MTTSLGGQPYAAVMVSWGAYETYDPGVDAPVAEVSRAEARAAFKRCMDTKASRIQMLSDLLEGNAVKLGTSNSAVQQLNDWFFAQVEPDPAKAGRLLPDWYSVVHDIALFLGEVMIERHPQLHWEFCTWGGKRSAAYHQHVVLGFASTNPRFRPNYDLRSIIGGYGHQIVGSRGSIASHGPVVVGSVMIDIDAAAARHRARGVPADKFVFLLEAAANRV